MKLLKHSLNFIGGRIIKTGLSVFITASICLFFELPAIFAVITAIVTTEPTASDSIKKGMIRFPASAIGAATSLTLIYIFGESALTYTLASVLTIMVCHHLKLDDGILVATLTAVAMIPVTNDHFVFAFLTRLGTTSIGIIVSTVVNLIILPPNYSPVICNNLNKLYMLAGDILEASVRHIFTENQSKDPIKLYQKLTKELERTFLLCKYQREEFKYHKAKTKEVRTFHYAFKQLNMLQQITFHLGNLQYVHSTKNEFNPDEEKTIKEAVYSIVSILKSRSHMIPVEHYNLIEQLGQQFWNWKHDMNHHSPEKYHHHFAPQTIVLFALLSLHDILEELEHFSKKYNNEYATSS